MTLYFNNNFIKKIKRNNIGWIISFAINFIFFISTTISYLCNNRKFDLQISIILGLTLIGLIFLIIFEKKRYNIMKNTFYVKISENKIETYRKDILNIDQITEIKNKNNDLYSIYFSNKKRLFLERKIVNDENDDFDKCIKFLKKRTHV